MIIAAALLWLVAGQTEVRAAESPPASGSRAAVWAHYREEAAQWQKRADEAFTAGKGNVEPAFDDSDWQEMKLAPVDAVAGHSIALAGPWRYRVAVALPPRPQAPGFGDKRQDSDVIREESKVPYYDLPPVLVTAEGKQVTTAEQWRNVRRPQILSLFANLVYGRVPEPESPIETH